MINCFRNSTKLKMRDGDAMRNIRSLKLWEKRRVLSSSINYFRNGKMRIQRLGKKIHMKLKAVQKYESPKNMEVPKKTIDQKDYMKYGPSDD